MSSPTSADVYWFTVIVAGTSGSLFAGLGLIAHGFSFAIVALFISGAFTGALLVPDLKPDAFKHPKTWQITAGALGFAFGVAYFAPSVQAIAIAALIGAAFGCAVPYWFKHGWQ